VCTEDVQSRQGRGLCAAVLDAQHRRSRAHRRRGVLFDSCSNRKFIICTVASSSSGSLLRRRRAVALSVHLVHCVVYE
jgi:hypothetical protein